MDRKIHAEFQSTGVAISLKLCLLHLSCTA